MAWKTGQHYDPFKAATVDGGYEIADGQADGSQDTPSSAPGGAMGGLLAAAPTGGAPVGNVAPGASQGAVTGLAQTEAPGGLDMLSGPAMLRQGIGQRNPPDRTPILTGLRTIY